MSADDDHAASKRVRRAAVAVQATRGIPTETLEAVAALPLEERPFALSKAAARPRRGAA